MGEVRCVVLDDATRAALEDQLRAQCDAADYEDAATEVVRAYGPELLGYLHAMASTAADADDLFADLCERIWTKLPEFRWESSARTWCYVIARNLLRDQRRAARGPRGRVQGMSSSRIGRLAADVRSSTPAYKRTAAKDRLREIRDALDPDDRTLLILRVDRRLPWRDIAAVLDPDAPAEELRRRSASLRKRFERLKEQLRTQMRQP